MKDWKEKQTASSPGPGRMQKNFLNNQRAFLVLYFTLDHKTNESVTPAAIQPISEDIKDNLLDTVISFLFHQVCTYNEQPKPRISL